MKKLLDLAVEEHLTDQQHDIAMRKLIDQERTQGPADGVFIHNYCGIEWAVTFEDGRTVSVVKCERSHV
ncbi:MAG TPA: hypothetical protein VLA12_20870 [Planctomycetaceae bacterium]|nr:hypothetical protein [Planctomycetaceae bacterium]